MIPLMSDARVSFLVWFVSIAIVVAAILIFIEVRIKRKKDFAAIKRNEKTPIDKMRIVLAGNAEIKKKFDNVSKTAKNYFKEEYGISLKADYSELAKKFEHESKKLEAGFCRGMFELYYSNKELTEERVRNLGEMLIEISKKRNFYKNISRTPAFWTKIDEVFRKIKEVVAKRIEKYVAFRREKMEEESRLREREDRELLRWVRRAISLGHNREKIASLITDGKRGRKEIERILKFYDRELVEGRAEDVSLQFCGDGDGVAKRIVQREKDWFEGGL